MIESFHQHLLKEHTIHLSPLLRVLFETKNHQKFIVFDLNILEITQPMESANLKNFFFLM